MCVARALSAFSGEVGKFLFHLGCFYVEKELLITGHLLKNVTKIPTFPALLDFLYH